MEGYDPYAENDLAARLDDELLALCPGGCGCTSMMCRCEMEES